ncbi:FG-GAP repeat domain-containing protein [Vulgatibacter sp.]|uniref:FG-GAP repeat domain-containing protein n=1 Tax=Vulgatibacter sp. TaxID=1971226 RepID=UPI003568DA10
MRRLVLLLPLLGGGCDLIGFGPEMEGGCFRTDEEGVRREVSCSSLYEDEEPIVAPDLGYQDRRIQLTVAGQHLRLAAGDADEDGSDDLLVAGDVQKLYRIEREMLTGLPLESGEGWSIDGWLAPQVGDVDGDGHLDLFARKWGAELYGSSGLMRGNGAGGFAAPVPLLEKVEALGPAPFSAFERLELSDVDGDGRADLLGLYGSWYFTWARGLEGGGFAQPEAWLEPYDVQAFRPRQRPTFASGDLDGDGRHDVVFGGHGGLVTILGAADGFGATVTSQLGDPGFLHGISLLADVDGDGHLDAVVAPIKEDGYGIPETWVHRGDGRGGFERWQTIHERRAGFGHAADFDGDGRADLFAGMHRNRVEALGWDGTGWKLVFAATGTDDEFLRYVYDIAVGDFDGNGFVDVAWATSIPDDYERCTLEVALVSRDEGP